MDSFFQCAEMTIHLKVDLRMVMNDMSPFSLLTVEIKGTLSGTGKSIQQGLDQYKLLSNEFLV